MTDLQNTTGNLIPISVTETDGIAELTVSAMDLYRLVNPKNTKIFILDKSTL